MNNRYKERISTGMIKEVIDDLITLSSTRQDLSEINNILILKKIHFNDNEENYHLKGIIPPNEYRINRNQVVNALLIIVDKIDKNQSTALFEKLEIEEKKKKTDILKQERDNYVLVFGRSTVGKTAFISSIARTAEGVSFHDDFANLGRTESFKYFPKESEEGLMEVNFSVSDSIGDWLAVNIIEMPDNDLKEILLFKEDDRHEISQKKISQLYILMTDIESGDKDDFVIAMFVKLLCESLTNLSFMLIITKWDLLEENKNRYYLHDIKTAEEYVKRHMPLTSRLLKSNEIIGNSIFKYTAKDYFEEKYIDTNSIINQIKMKLEIN